MTTRPAAPPPPVKGAPPAPSAPADNRSPRLTVPLAVGLEISKGVVTGAESIVIFGPGGIGKSTLAAWLPSPLFLDVERGTVKLDVDRDASITDWLGLRGRLASINASPPPGIQTIVLDTATVAEELAKEHVIATKKAGGQKGEGPARIVSSIEDYGWGKGWQYVAEEFNGLLADMDRLLRKGLNVCLIAHEVASPVPNPGGEDFIRWEPHLYAGDKNKRGSIRDRVKQWANHVLFVGYDVHVEDGKGRGSGTRTIYTIELPTHIAKSRTAQVAQPFEISDPGAIWRTLGITKQ